jgi:hypothetical protein
MHQGGDIAKTKTIAVSARIPMHLCLRKLQKEQIPSNVESEAVLGRSWLQFKYNRMFAFSKQGISEK